MLDFFNLDLTDKYRDIPITVEHLFEDRPCYDGISVVLLLRCGLAVYIVEPISMVGIANIRSVRQVNDTIACVLNSL
jgi:hypothetical protein